MGVDPLSAIRGLPRSVSVPALIAGLAYANARLAFNHDAFQITTGVGFGLKLARLEKADEINCFRYLEQHAKNPKIANKAFLAIPEADAAPGEQTEWTFAEGYELVLKYARWLKDEHHVQKNEFIAMDFTNKPEFVWVWFALWSIGAKPAFINTNLRGDAFLHCVRISESRLLLVDPAIRDVLTEETTKGLADLGNGRAVDVAILDDGIKAQILAGIPYRAPDSERSGEKYAGPALLIYTSGTTGLPKAAKVNWGKAIGSVFYWNKIIGMKDTDRWYTAMPLYHSSASLMGVCQTLSAAAPTVILGKKFSPRTVMRDVVQTKATMFQYIGEMCRYLLTSPPTPYDRAHNLRLAFGNGMRPDVWQRFKDRFGIPVVLEFYGATEGPSVSHVYEANGFLRGAIGRSGKVGRLLFGGATLLLRYDFEQDAVWRDPQTGFCQKAQINTPGELVYWLDPANIDDKFHGYVGNEKATASKILRDVFKKGDAYYRTGDLQRLDSEGRWWFVDRIGDTFRWKSENVSTAEVAEALGAHPALLEANVYGVEVPNHDGRAGCAAIVLADGKTMDAKLRQDLAQEARKRLPRYAVPLFLRLPNKVLEVTGTHKHQKVALRNQGIDPAQTGDDSLFWLPPGSNSYEPFDKNAWENINSGVAKL